MKTAYKFLRKGMKSNYDGSKWELGVWREVHAPVRECEGLNCSKMIPDALGYVKGEILAKVEYGGKVIDSGDKLTCQKMRVVESWKCGKMESIKMAVFAALLVLPIFEKKYPDDDRPRKAIEAAEAWINRPTKKNANAAAYAARAAADAAYAARAAAAAANAYAAYAANAAANAAAKAAANAADAKAAKMKIHRYVLKMLKGDV